MRASTVERQQRTGELRGPYSLSIKKRGGVPRRSVEKI